MGNKDGEDKDRMNAEVKVRWVEALRSGKYTQNQYHLRFEFGGGDVGYCCLGVLCEISGMGSWAGSSYRVGDEFGQAFPPPRVAVWAELSSGDQEDLSTLNDGRRTTHLHTFSEIADYIEQNL